MPSYLNYCFAFDLCGTTLASPYIYEKKFNKFRETEAFEWSIF